MNDNNLKRRAEQYFYHITYLSGNVKVPFSSSFRVFKPHLEKVEAKLPKESVKRVVELLEYNI